MARRLYLLVLWLALMFAYAGMGAAAASAHPTFSELETVPTRCLDEVNGGNSAGQFNPYPEGTPGTVELDKQLICAPIRRFWRVGFPNRSNTVYYRVEERRYQLGAALFIVAHEERHVEQWAEGGFTQFLITGCSRFLYWGQACDGHVPKLERNADCQGAYEFKPMARRAGLSWRQRRIAQYLITHPVSVGYNQSTRYWEGCWR